MKCPHCANPDAFLGFSSIDCPNSNCRYFQGNKSNVAVMPPVMPRGAYPAVPPVAPTVPVAPLPALQLQVTIISQTPKLSSVVIAFKGKGDPGQPDKRVEFHWSLPSNPVKNICTLSSAQRYYVDGIDADDVIVYNTHWLCVQDGVQPTDQFILEARIFP